MYNFNEVFIYPLFSTCIKNYYTVYYNHLLDIDIGKRITLYVRYQVNDHNILCSSS